MYNVQIAILKSNFNFFMFLTSYYCLMWATYLQWWIVVPTIFETQEAQLAAIVAGTGVFMWAINYVSAAAAV